MTATNDEADRLRTARASLILRLRQSGITERALLVAFETVPHEAFVPHEFVTHAYGESSLPIACGQSITAPNITASLLSLLAPVGAQKVLEIGTGSGYATALLSKVARRIYSVERFGTLAREAQARWSALNCANVIGFHADGLEGLAAQAPFDRIVLTGSVGIVPPELADQLADDGILVAPVGDADKSQTILRIVRAGNKFIESEHGVVRLAPLMRGKSAAL